MGRTAPQRLKLAVTGGIASGKTAVCRCLADLGARVIDADDIGRRLLTGEILKQVVADLGGSFLRADGRIDRRELGCIVFSSPEALKKFNSLIHPPLLDRLRRELDAPGKGEEPVVVDAALIFEWGIESWFDKLLVVVAPDPVRIERIVSSVGLSLAEARGRLGSQLAQEEKAARAEYVIENDGTLEDLEQRLSALVAKLEE